MKKPVNIIVAEDTEIYLDGMLVALNGLPNINVVATATNGNDLVKLAAKHQPHLVITDIVMPVLSGTDACRMLTEQHPHIFIIATTIFEEESLIFEMIEAGVTSFVMKNSGKHDLLKAIETTLTGQSYYCTATNKHFARHLALQRQKSKLPQFPERHIEFIKLVGRDLTHEQIAKKLCISKSTADMWSSRILHKMGEHTAVGMITYALKHGLIRQDDILK